MRVFISAGEASGDTHAAAVIQELSARFGTVQIDGIAGENMVRAGCNPLVHTRELSVMGVTDVLKALPRIRRIRDQVLGWARENRPDVAILVDYPGFHMRLGEALRKEGIPVIQYIAPKLWAWGERRVRRLSRSQDKLACIFPFEPQWFGERGIKGEYVGNPSAAHAASGWSNSELKAKLGVPDHHRLLAILPGSRPGELSRHVPLLVDSWKRIRGEVQDVSAVVPRAPDVDLSALEPLTSQGVKLIDRLQDGYAMRADAAIAASGTATLELALWGVPTLLMYRASPLSMWIGLKLVKLKCVGLANILLGDKMIMPELIQDQASVPNICWHALQLLAGGDAANSQKRAFAELSAMLGEGNPAERVVTMIGELAEKKSRQA